MDSVFYERQAILSSSADMRTIIPQNLELNNFAMFCGTFEQRLTVALHAASRYLGEVGIVVLHDASGLNAKLFSLCDSNSGTNVQFLADTGKVYDPLYGLSANAILDLLAPMDPSNPMSHGVSTIRMGLHAYLRIMEYRFSQNQRPFGRYPYNLDLLLQLCSMPYETLKNCVLDYIPSSVSEPIKNVLGASGMQQSVLACVNNLVVLMSDYLWQERGFENHSGISIVDSVINRGLISVRVPQSHAGILNYIDVELKVLQNRNIPFLLVNCGVNISQNPAMQKWFLDEHEGKGYYTAIVSDSLSSIITDSVDQKSKLFSQYQQILVFNCSGAGQAEPFSAQFGDYYRKETEYAFGFGRKFFEIIPHVQHNKNERYVRERNVKVEDLMTLYSGALLCGKAYALPTIIRNFELNGGNRNGLFLP